MGKLLTIGYSLALCALWFVAFTSSAGQDWELQIQRIETNVSDPNEMKFELRPIRNGPGKYSVNGSLIAGFDVDDSCLVVLKVYRSESGTSLYRLTPYAYPESSFYKFMNKIYCKILEEDLKTCSTLPRCEGKWESPLKKGTYNFNKCDLTTEGMPGHMSPGYYKIEARLKCKTILYVTLYIKVDSKSLV